MEKPSMTFPNVEPFYLPLKSQPSTTSSRKVSLIAQMVQASLQGPTGPWTSPSIVHLALGCQSL